ncbi:MAG: hypothetical protein ACYCST_09980 [Acidimicrobiales bacterium]
MTEMSRKGNRVRIVPPPRYAWLRVWDCQICGHESLAHPVFIEADGERVAAGSGCAARLLSGPSASSSATRRVAERARVLEAESLARARVDEERCGRYEAALAEYAADGNAVVRQGPETSDFNRLRLEHGRRDETLHAPANFAAWLEERVSELRGRI